MAHNFTRDQKCATELDGWNLNFEDRLLEYTARVLPPEKIYQKHAQFSYRPNEADWSRDMRGNELISAVQLSDFMILSTKRDLDKAKDFMMTLQKVGPAMGISIANRYNQLVLDNDRTDNFLSNIENNLTRNTQLVSIVYW